MSRNLNEYLKSRASENTSLPSRIKETSKSRWNSFDDEDEHEEDEQGEPKVVALPEEAADEAPAPEASGEPSQPDATEVVAEVKP